MVRLLDYHYKIFSIFGFSALTFALIITQQSPPATGYEISIYEAYPSIFWISLFGPIVIGQLILARNMAMSKSNGLWKSGVLLMVIPGLVLVGLPRIREYPIYGRADVPTHVGYMKDIISTSNFSSGNIYPALHDLGVSIAFITGMDVGEVVTIIPIVFTGLFYASIFLMANESFGWDGRFFSMLAFGLIPLFTASHVFFTPFNMSTLLLPFILYLYFKFRRHDDSRVNFLVILAIIAIVPYHPLTSLYITGILLIATLVEYWLDMRARSFNLSIVSLIGFVTWYFGFLGILIRISTSIYNIIFVSGESSFERYGQVVTTFSPSIVDLIQVALLRHGLSIIGALLGFVLTGHIIWRYIRYHQKPSFTDAFIVASFIAFGTTSALFFIFDVSGGFARPLIYSRFFALIAAGSVVVVILNATSRRGREFGLYPAITILFVVLVVLSTFTVFVSPLERRHNHQLTEMEIEGGSWFFTYRNESMEVLELGVSNYRLYDMQFGRQATRQNIVQPEIRPPDHFGYDRRNTLGESYFESTDRYMTISRLARVTYPKVFPEYRMFWRFTPNEFDHLSIDPSVNHLYDNGEFDTYSIHGTNESISVTSVPS